MSIKLPSMSIWSTKRKKDINSSNVRKRDNITKWQYIFSEVRNLTLSILIERDENSIASIFHSICLLFSEYMEEFPDDEIIKKYQSILDEHHIQLHPSIWERCMIIKVNSRPCSPKLESNLFCIITGIIGFIHQWETNERLMLRKIKAHDKFMRTLLQSLGGREINNSGCIFFCVFNCGHSCMRFCMILQRIIYKKSRLKLRIGVHYGAPILRKRINDIPDYVGPVVNKTLRIQEQGAAGKIYTSPEVAHRLSSDYWFRSIGERNLRGIGTSTIYEVIGKRKYNSI